MTWMSRRALLKSFLGTLLLPLSESAEWLRARAAGLSVERLRQRPGDALSRSLRVHYRADATILLLSIPIYRRRGAGGGYAELEERADGNRNTLGIRFSAGSHPEHARGLNRLGYIEEVVTGRPGAVDELAYFGFITSSPEKDDDEARRALESGQETITYKAAEGHIRAGAETSRKSELNVSEPYSWTEMGQLLPCVRNAFLSDSEAETQTTACQEEPATFLYSVLSASWGRENTFEATYRYLAKAYRMQVSKEPDRETGRRMAEEGLTTSPETVAVLKGTIRELENDKTVKFKLWIENNGRRELPIRFEYKARPFLRVSFEKDPTQGPAAPAADPLHTE